MDSIACLNQSYVSGTRDQALYIPRPYHSLSFAAARFTTLLHSLLDTPQIRCEFLQSDSAMMVFQSKWLVTVVVVMMMVMLMGPAECARE